MLHGSNKFEGKIVLFLVCKVETAERIGVWRGRGEWRRSEGRGKEGLTEGAKSGGFRICALGLPSACSLIGEGSSQRPD